MTPTINHSDDGTLVHDTERGDTAMITHLKACGFRWSRNLDAWYLPRNWSEPVRRQRVGQLQRLVDEVAVQYVDTPQRSVAEREADKRERAAARAERMDRLAANADHRADQADAYLDRMREAIPFGQPILLGHHSQRRAERDAERIRRNMHRVIDERQQAESARQAASRARSTATGQESTITIGNRIERTEAEIRRLQRRLDGSGKAIYGENAPATGDYRKRLQRQLDDLADRVRYDRETLARRGVVEFSRETVAAGDFVKIRGTWYPVIRANAKTVAVPNTIAPASSATTPWREVTAHLARSEATAAKVRALAASVSAAFDGLRDQLLAQAEQLDAES